MHNIYPIYNSAMSTIHLHDLSILPEFDRIPSRFEVHSILSLEPIDGGLGGIRLREMPVPPYIKDYDSYADGPPSHWARNFDLSTWGFLLTRNEADPSDSPALGGAAVAWNTSSVNMLEDRPDLAVLWDIRVQPYARGQGIGRSLFLAAVDWARARHCTQLKIETQNINVAACRFYAALGCELGMIHRYGYAAVPGVTHEAMLFWYFQL